MLSNDYLEKIAGALPVDDCHHASLSRVLLACVLAYFSVVQIDTTKKIREIAAEMYQATVHCVAYCNHLRACENKRINKQIEANKEDGVTDAPFMAFLQMLKCPSELGTTQIAYAITRLYCVCRIPCAGEAGDIDKDLLCIYQSDGPKEGLYSYDDTTFEKIVKAFNNSITAKGYAEVIRGLKSMAPRVERCQDRDLVPVGNGIFNYKTKELMPFSPDYVFLSKCNVNYNPNAQNVVIYNPTDGTHWDIESWMQELSDDSDIVNLLWEIMGAIIRPFVRWEKCAIFYGTTGNNGKGTLCELMRSLCGEGRYACIPIDSFSQEFKLEQLIGTSAIIVDENNVGAYLDKAADFKAIVTNDIVQINRKNKQAIPYRFCGFMVQCFNDLPKMKDRSESIYRRCLFVEFKKCFTVKQRKYIKDDYLHRQDVLEYVLFRVLNMNYYQLSEPAACRAVLDDYKKYNDSIAQWWDEISGEGFQWDMLPWRFLYAVYKHWFEVNNPSGKVQRSREFIDEIRLIAAKDDVWMCPDKGKDGKDKQLSGYINSNVWEPLGTGIYLRKVSWNDDTKSKYEVGNPKNWQGRQRGLVRRQVYLGQVNGVAPGVALNTAPGAVGQGGLPGQPASASQAASVALIRGALSQREV